MRLKTHRALASAEAARKLQARLHAIAIDAVEDAVHLAGGASKLGSKVGVSRQTVNNWRRRGASLAMCLQIERVTGVSVERLAPFSDAEKLRSASKTEARNSL